MNIEIGLAIAALSVSVIALGFAVISCKKYKSSRERIEFAEARIIELQEDLAKSRESIETSSKRLADHGRRVAWLETRIRKPRSVGSEVIDDKVVVSEPAEPKKLNITERRHRVISLASRGQRPEAIAATLGMLPGEVELIVNLNHAMAAAGH
jgi:precorrin-6B methylase 1